MVDRTFINELASKAPTPGGGGASAYCGALGAALSSMVCNLTLGKAAYAEVEAEIAATAQALGQTTALLLHLIDEDARAFEPLAQAYKMPKDTPEEAAAKEAALQQALIGACEVPLAIMGACARVIELAGVVAEKGSRMAISDAGVSVLLAKAALQAASLNVLINCASMKDRARAEAYLADVNHHLEQGCEKADQIYLGVLAALN